MNSDSAYTPLETLLLFQALRADGVDSISFNRISEQLKNIPSIRNDRRYDGGRLSPDALRELYLTLLKDEVKRDLERQANGDNQLTNGDVSPASRKRKAPSPSLPTVSEATKHSHLIPQLVTRLYTGFRQHYVDTAIRPLEKRYATIHEEISEIESGQWDERLQKKQVVSQTQSPKPSSTAHTQPVVARADNLQPSPVVASPSVPAKQPESAPQGHVKRYSQAKIDAMINHGPESQDSPIPHQRTASNTSLPPLAELAPQSPHHAIPPNASGAVPTQMQPMQQMPHHGYTQSPPAGHQSPYPPQNIHPRPGSISGPQIQQTMSRASSSPRPILPPPKGMQYQPTPPIPHAGSPGVPHPHMPHQHPQAHQQHFQPQQRMPAGPSPTGEMPPRAYPGTPLAPHPPAGYYQQQQQSYAGRRPSYPPVQGHQTPTYPTQPPHPGGGYMLPPFQIQPQDHGKPIQQPLRPHQPPMSGQRPMYPSPGPVAPATGPRPPPVPSPHIQAVLAALATPPRTRSIWKRPLYNTPIKDQMPKPSPQVEPLSPTRGRAKPARSNAPTIEEPPATESATKLRSSKRRPNARDKSPHSVVSSVADESLLARTRSQSVSTVAGAHPPSDDRPRSRNGVKAEASTPSNLLEEPDTGTGTSSAKMTRTRRGTLQSQHQQPNKRKWRESPPESAQEREWGPTPPPRSNTVVATRNLAKMSSAVMNDIVSHKHASYFAKEVRDKDIPGYSEIVKQPQNLKSIRSAITAGGKAIAAATANTDSPAATPSASSTTVELERTADLIPPKAIVNGAQLEKELMRMLANAYMFNPGEDGMALSTKEMFEDVEQKISEWRGTEREAGGDEDEDVKGKRRKV
ncbi:hypothetical protein DOTSEDRAFT_67604 [Lecanosticta acicola]|uniref:Bromo domain-containing protein n=1 Tax=Lecanosticta acicola TaxID=111012 RepID=A0AAI9EA54_9PEZI|nr:hypothetical protein DOTSEDRAFT_67604 [Lecanosticta acicola]